MPVREGTDPTSARAPSLEEDDGQALIGLVVDGRYRLDSVLGRGGMGLVYKAHHVGLRRQVAVKILHPSLAASPDVRNRFEREALAVGKIDHPNCVAVYDSGRLPDGSLYLAMELLDGKSLADVLEQEGQIAPGRALHILAHILRGLAHIHLAGLIHRDIKPENIFLIRQGEDVDFAKILDFGIAKPMDKSDLDDGVKLTQAGMAFGTPIYMAPEQALGNPMDGRADLYAAAVMGFEMLCGQPPFYSDDKLEVMSMHTARPVPPMRQRLIKNGRPVPSSIERLIAKGLTKKPSERYPTAEVFLAEVEAALHTKDGGVTEVEFEKMSTTGSTPLITDDGQLALDNDFQSESPSDIADLIDQELSVPKQPRLATPPKGQGLPPAIAVAAGAPPSRVPQGGVSVGLPYTGPTGEPIFGLTPEQRLAQVGKESGIANALEADGTSPRARAAKPASRRRWLVYAGILTVAIAAGVAIAVVTTRPDGGDGAEIDPGSPAGQALTALDRGDPDKAIALLDAEGDKIANDPDAQLVLGHAHAAKHESGPSLYAYERALKLDAALESNAMLRANLRAMAADKDLTVVSAAFDLWVGRTKDDRAKPALLKAAVSDNRARRHGVRPLLDKHRLIDQVDLLVSYSFDLEQEPSCDERREAVAKLRALNDPRAVPALERAVAKKIKSGSMRGKAYSPCLLDDAKAAIGYLRGLQTAKPK